MFARMRQNYVMNWIMTAMVKQMKILVIHIMSTPMAMVLVLLRLYCLALFLQGIPQPLPIVMTRNLQ